MMGNQRVWGLHLVFLSMFMVASEYTCLGSQNSTRICHERERQALLKFKQSVEDKYGMLSSWVGTGCCLWKGVRCDGATGSVISLHLRGNYWEIMENYPSFEEDYYLVGDEVNTYLAELRHLKHMDLSGNNFQGSQIPEFIGSFKQLSYLNLSYAEFGGIIPHHIGNLSNLKVLDLGSTFFTSGLIANDVAWVSSLSSLDHLDLSYVDLYQAKNIDMVFHIIPSLTYLSLSECWISNVDLGLHLNSSKILPNIQHLDLSSNHFEGQLPHFFQNMTSLLFLDLSWNNLSLAWNSLKLLNTIPSLLELHMSECGLINTHFSSAYFNSSAHSNIQYLDLSENSIGGRFPSVLMNMTSLRVLDLTGNSLNSSIPVMPYLLSLDVSFNKFDNIELVGIWRQCHLKELRLYGNHFGGEMIGPSPNTSECSQYALEMLYLDNTYQLSGSVPEYIGRLTNLIVLNLGYNRLAGSIPTALEKLRSLEVLDLSSNAFTGSITESFGRLTSLRVLNLKLNSLTGLIPIALEKLRSLEVLDLSSNAFTGSIPESFGRLINLRVLDLTSNSFTGSIPKALEGLRSLEVLDLSYNHLNGSIPESFGRLAGLTCLNLESNRLTGVIPTSLGRLDSLQKLSVASNLLTGPIPVSIGQLTKLVDLRLSNNSLEGVVFEAHFANLSMLKNLYIGPNDNLIFNISHEWTPRFQLRYIDFGSCKIANGFPKWLETQRKLKWLSLSNASLHGILPRFFRKMSMIKYLDLSYNKVSGSMINLPFSIYLETLFLQDNLFSGSLPRSLCRSTRLFALVVSSNRLSGNIPDCVGNLLELEILVLNSNRLSGVLPSSLGNIYSLRWLQLNDCNFNGELPSNLGNLRWLQVLELGNNEFSGSIPKWIGENFIDLVILRLHKNNFTGGIPQSLCKCSFLQILDIAHNNLKGSIPRCFGELRWMIEEAYPGLSIDGFGFDAHVTQVMKGIQLDYTKNLDFVINMDLSSNKLTGEIPPEVTALVLLLGLNLSHNHLSGSIPNNIGNMKALNSLDLSDNLLTGMIPQSTAALNFLSFMNLSHNNLSGRIPTGNQLQTLNDPSMYAGNRDLCGDPLPNNCSSHENPPTPISRNKYEPKKVLFYLDITCGFATGFWGIIGVLLFKKQWRRKLFMIAEAAMDKIYVMVALRVSKIKRWREA